jgi:TfoX/Sxy family transcriptional regulator of competence genes
MPYEEQLVERVRGVFAKNRNVAERKMFGGLTFMVRGNMACGVAGDRLMVRVGADGYDDALARPHVRPMDFTGRQMTSFVFVEPAGLKKDTDLKAWVQRGVDFAMSLPSK